MKKPANRTWMKDLNKQRMKLKQMRGKETHSMNRLIGYVFKTMVSWLKNSWVKLIKNDAI